MPLTLDAAGVPLLPLPLPPAAANAAAPNPDICTSEAKTTATALRVGWVVDSRFHFMDTPGAFMDATLPSNYSPFGIQTIGRWVVVSYDPTTCCSAPASMMSRMACWA